MKYKQVLFLPFQSALFILLSIYSVDALSNSCGLIPSDYPIYSDSEIELKKDILVNGNGIIKDKYKPNAGISPAGIITTELTPTLPDLDPAAFPPNGESTDIKSSSSFVIDGSSEVYYDELKLEKKNTSLTFTGSGPFHINKLETKEENSVINFSAGIYYINELKLKKENTIINITSGPVIIHIGKKFEISKEDVGINKDGNVDNFVVYLHSSAKFEAKEKDLNFTGILYGPDSGEIKFKKENITFRGAIITGNKVKVEKEGFSLIYTPEDQVAVSRISTCLTFETAVPIATWHLDEPSWSGITNEVIDETRNGYNGTASNGAATEMSIPAINGNPGSCGYAVFDSTQKQKVTIPHSPNLNPDSFSVAFWAKVRGNTRYWRGPITSRDSRRSTGFNVYADEKNRWAFWTGKGSGVHSFEKLTGPTVINDTWTHIVASFGKTSTENGIHKGIKRLYVNGVLVKTQTNKRYTPNTTVDMFLGASYKGGKNDYFFDGDLDEVRLFDSVLTQSQVEAIMAETHPCDVTSLASNFKCVNTASNPITGRLFTKLANTPFTVDVVALEDASTVANGYSNTVTIELVDASSGSCETHSVLSPAINQSLTFLSGTGVETSNNMTSTQAYQNLKCRVTDSVTALVGCSSDAFAIRPSVFTVTSPINNSGNSGSPVQKAGTDFTITATTNVPNYNGTPIIDTSKVQAHAGAVQIGTITGAFPLADATTGNSTGVSFTYNEVGNFLFDINGVVDTNFTTIDKVAGDCLDSSSNTPDSNGKIGCNIANVAVSNSIGRFTPDHFELSSSSIANRVNESCSPVSSFTYTNEAFKTDFTLIAKNKTNTTTQNYYGGFVKFDGSNPSNFHFGAVDMPSSTALSSRISTVSSSCLWGASSNHGQGICTAKLGLSSSSSEGPYNSFQLGIDPTDDDGINLGLYNLDTSIPSDTNDRGSLSTTVIRSGRLIVHNAHGSEMAALLVPLSIEYFNGLNWSVNVNDNCSSITDNDFNRVQSIANSTTSVPLTTPLPSTLLTTQFVAGKNTLTFSAPGEDNIGHIDITADLSSMPWLQFDWNGNGSHGDNPTGRASFGIFKGSEKLIFRREVY